MRWCRAWIPLSLLLLGACGPPGRSVAGQEPAPGDRPPGEAGTSKARPATVAPAVLVDGAFADWQGSAPAFSDPTDDSAGADLGDLWLAHDARFLYLSFELASEVNLREGNDFELHLDTDDDPGTGPGGAELVWRFRERSGLVVRGETASEVGHAALGLVIAPTVASARFEVALDRRAVERVVKHGDLDQVALEGSGSGEPTSGPWRIALATAGDRLPDRGSVRYPFDRPRPAGGTDSAGDLGDRHPGALRFMTYNVEHDGLLDPELRPSFARILAAVKPDLIGFQEVYEHDAETVKRAVAAILGGEWYAAKVGLDLVAVSRTPILRAECITHCSEYGSTGAFLVDTPLGELFFIAVHPPCCTGGDPPMEAQRQYVIDVTMAYLRDVRRSPPGGGAVKVPPGTPILIAGDLNLVGDRQPLETLLTGEIVHRELGDSAAPDWDGSPLADLQPVHTDLPMVFTWFRESRGSYSPGRLDFIVYSDSVLRPTRGYVLFTQAMSDAALEANGLERRDTCVSDHLPVVGDFVLR